jgi:hypothetical protein
MKKNLLALTCSILSFAAFSQQDSLLKNFKFRIDKYRTITFDLGGESQLDNVSNGLTTQKYNLSTGRLGATYSTVKSTDKILLTTSVALSSNFLTSKDNNSSSINKRKFFSTTPYYSVLNQWFSKDHFIELGTEVSANYYHEKGSQFGSSFNNKEREYSFTLNTGIGKGRLENITDMQNAIWLNKALEEATVLTHLLSPAEKDELGRTLTKANRTRILDYRRRIQFILSTVDGYLQEKKLISKTDINYFSTLNDIIFFAFNTPRLSGTEKFIRLSPTLSGSISNRAQGNQPDKYENRFNSQSVVLSSGISRYIPTNIKHQNNYGASLKLGWYSNDATYRFFTNGNMTDENKGNTISKTVGVNLFFNHSIYPNTRTILDFYLQSESGYLNEEQQSGLYESAILSGSIDYFITYRTKINCSIEGQYHKNDHLNPQNLVGYAESLHLYAHAGIQINL